MGALLGLMFGVGVLLIWSHPGEARPSGPSLASRWQERLIQAGLPGVRPAGLVAACLGLTLVVFVLVLALSSSFPIAGAFALLAANAPFALLRSRRRKRSAALAEEWPVAVDNLVSAVRAGLSLPEALGQVGVRGPAALRGAFGAFADDFRATGSFSRCLDALKVRLADPTGDRLVETLRMARDVGGSDVGNVLRTLSAFLREESRVRGELLSRQSWTVNGARLAVAAPWLVLALLATNPESVAAYNTATGVGVLGLGGALCVLAYRLMLWIGRLPEEQRVLA